MKRWLPLAVGSGLVIAACTDSRGPTQPPAPGAPRFLTLQNEREARVHLMLPRGQARKRKPPPTPNTGIYYHGGPIIYSTNVAALYWSSSAIYNGGPTPGTHGNPGCGAATPADNSIVGYFMCNLAPNTGGTQYFNINTTYYDGSNTHVNNVVTYTQYWADNVNPVPQSPSDTDIQNEIEAGFTSGNLTYEPNTLYEVYTGPGINPGGGFGTRYCAYHGWWTDGQGRNVKFAAEPHAYDFPPACSALQGSNNNDAAADAEVNLVAHETEETTTDENLNAWYDLIGNENADKCAWQFGTTFPGTNGAQANAAIGAKDFLIQMNWVDASDAAGNPIGCRNHWP